MPSVQNPLVEMVHLRTRPYLLEPGDHIILRAERWEFLVSAVAWNGMGSTVHVEGTMVHPHHGWHDGLEVDIPNYETLNVIRRYRA